METRALGTRGLTVSAQGLGCMGMSEFYGPTDEAEAIATIHRAHATHPISALQSEWSLWSRDIEREVVGTVRALGIGIVAYSPLGRGFLTGQITSPEDFGPDDFRKYLPRFQGEKFARNLQLVDAVREMASEKGVTPG